LFAIILAVSIVAAIPVTVVNRLVSEKNIEKFVDTVISAFDIDKLAINIESGEGVALSEAILMSIEDCEGIEYISKEQLNREFTEKFVKEMSVSFLTQFAASLENGNLEISWAPEGIYAFIEENESDLQKLALESGYYGQIDVSANKEVILEGVKEVIGEEGIEIDNLIEDVGALDQINSYLSYAQLLFSKKTVFLAWGLVALITLILLLINIGYFSSFLRASGIPAFVVGGLFALLSVMFESIIDMLNLPFENIVRIIKDSANILGNIILIISLIVLAVGFIFIVLSIVIYVVSSKKRRQAE